MARSWTWPLHLSSPWSDLGERVLGATTWDNSASPPSTCGQEYCQLNKNKTSPTKYIETVLSAGNGFLQSRGLTQKPSQHFLSVWVPELRSNCTVAY